MTNPQTGPIEDRFEVRATADTHFGWLRTRLSVERTLMAYLRTAVALIGFGFTIVQFFNHLPNVPGSKLAVFPDAPYYLGLSLISCGILALVVSVWEYHWMVRYLWSGSFATVAGVTREGKQTPLYTVTFALLLVGLFAFFAVLFRLA